MKTLKTILIAGFVVLTMVSLAKSEYTSKTAKKAINMEFEQTANVPGLNQAMKLQLDPDMLNTFQLVYSADVEYRNYTIKVTGTYNQWSRFFSPSGTALGRHKYTENQR